ncbi:hypothetical protein R5W24_004537 [Gemmata sp. JC717]|uniref:hypothetical protein n=1 Tax=Gemmata algarum TaxID=2975278 RepID=UPI0021BB8DD6|nr:hypothetical protein [Gemmata algarum]MDY3555394.1 hypothetical protein [Gemmata algarum]
MSVADELRLIAWRFWGGSLTARGTDRREALRQLKVLATEYKTLRTPEADTFFRQLELTLAPRTAKPGTVEALIDELTDYWDDPYSLLPTPAAPTSYWRLAELGFDAVPALIAHLNDDRLTRAHGLGSQFGTSHHLTVGHLCSRLLFYLSAGTISANQQWEAGGARLDPAEVRKWFAAAQKVGEERWLVMHAVPPFVGRAVAYREDRPVFVGKGLVSHEGRTEPHIVRVLGAKYPARLPAVYRTMLGISVEGGILDDFVNELVASRLPRDQKIALLEEGAASDSPDHWVPALEGLAQLDRARLRRHLKPALMRVWLRAWLGHPDPKDGSRLVRLAEAADDRGCWEALASATRAVGVGCRMDAIRHIVPCAPPDRPDPMRHERTRFLMPFLDDRTVDKDGDGTGPEVRDYAASQLAGLLGFRVQRDPFLYRPVFDAERDPISRVIFRMAARRAGARVLAEEN